MNDRKIEKAREKIRGVAVKLSVPKLGPRPGDVDWVEEKRWWDPSTWGKEEVDKCSVHGCGEVAPYFLGWWAGGTFPVCPEHYKSNDDADGSGPIWEVSGWSWKKDWAEEYINE